MDDPGTSDPVPTNAEYRDRLAKFSLQVRTVLRAPEILAVSEAENLTVLQDLADEIERDDPSIVYTPYLLEGNDVGGIDVGFLVRGSFTRPRSAPRTTTAAVLFLSCTASGG